MSGAGGFDWQFLVVSLAALWGAWALLRPLLRWRAARKRALPACARCAAGESCGTAEPAKNGGLVTIGAGGATGARRAGGPQRGTSR